MFDAEAAGKGVGLILIGRDSRRAASPPEHGGGREHLQHAGGDSREPQQHEGFFTVDGASRRGCCGRAVGPCGRRCGGAARVVGGGGGGVEDDTRLGGEQGVGQPYANRG